MIGPSSRYAQAVKRSSPTHRYEADGSVTVEDGTGEPLVDYRETSYLLTVLPLPDPPEIQYMLKETDNVNLLAHLVLKDPEKWWVVADANPQIRHPLDMKTGDIIYLPT